MALIGELERRAARILVGGDDQAGKSALVQRIVHDLRAPRLAHRPFHSDAELAASVAHLVDRSAAAGDVEQHLFAHDGRAFILLDGVDARGGRPDGALIVVDALRGVTARAAAALDAALQSGIARVIVAVNRMDAAGYEYEVFKSVAAQVAQLTAGAAQRVSLVPVSAWRGDNVAHRGDNIDWYRGPTLVEFLATIEVGADARVHA